MNNSDDLELKEKIKHAQDMMSSIGPLIDQFNKVQDVIANTATTYDKIDTSGFNQQFNVSDTGPVEKPVVKEVLSEEEKHKKAIEMIADGEVLLSGETIYFTIAGKQFHWWLSAALKNQVTNDKGSLSKMLTLIVNNLIESLEKNG